MQEPLAFNMPTAYLDLYQLRTGSAIAFTLEHALLDGHSMGLAKHQLLQLLAGSLISSKDSLIWAPPIEVASRSYSLLQSIKRWAAFLPYANVPRTDLLPAKRTFKTPAELAQASTTLFTRHELSTSESAALLAGVVA